MSNLVKKVQTLHHTTTCRKKKYLACRFNSHWTPSDKIRIVRFEQKNDKIIIKQSKKLTEKVLSYIVTKILLQKECVVTAEQYNNALGCVEKQVSILYKRKPCEGNIVPYNTGILLFLRQPKISSFIYPVGGE